MTTSSDVAVTIRSQIMAGEVPGGGYRGGTHAMMCWGFRDPMCATDEDGCHSLIFKVSGLLHKGKVKVKLMGNDTYTIFTHKGRQLEWQKQYSDVYCEDLTRILDRIIER